MPKTARSSSKTWTMRGSAGGWQRSRTVRVVANADVTEGNAYVSEAQTETGDLPDPTVAQIAFDPDYFQVTQGSSEPVVYSKANLYHRVFNYKLFDATTGAKVTRNAGFPIQLQNGQNGYVGYYGIWGPYGTTLANGARTPTWPATRTRSSGPAAS